MVQLREKIFGQKTPRIEIQPEGNMYATTLKNHYRPMHVQ